MCWQAAAANPSGAAPETAPLLTRCRLILLLKRAASIAALLSMVTPFPPPLFPPTSETHTACLYVSVSLSVHIYVLTGIFARL